MEANSALPRLWLAVLALVACCCGCSSYSGAHSQADFSLQASASSLTVVAGGAAQPLTVTANGSNGFSASIAVTVGSVPAGVIATPASFTLAAGASQTVKFSAAATAASTTATVQIQGVSGALRHVVPAPIVVTGKAVNAGIDFTTYHFDIARTGLNPNETELTPASVNSSAFGLIRMLPVDGKVDAEPLYLAGLTIGGTPHNVVYAASEHDSVFAFDADTGAQLWKTSILGANETTSDDHGCGQISPEIGITATPVIDRKAGPRGAIFVVGMSQDAGGAYHHRLHALDIASGSELAGSPVEIRATYPGSGAASSGGNVVFEPGQYAERAGLLLMNGTLYLGWTSHCDGMPYTGWLMAYSESSLAQTAVLNLTPNGSEGSIWMAGSGLAADPSGNIYILDANGTFDTTLDANGFPTKHDFGNAFLKISTANGLKVADYFQPSNTVSLSDSDTDLGSGGVIVLPDQADAFGITQHLAVGAGKDHNIYLANRDSMGKFNAGNNDALYQELDGVLNGVWGMPAYFNKAVYYPSQYEPIRKFPLANARLASAATAQTPNSFPYPGGTPSISSNGAGNGIVWAVENVSPAVLHAYDADTLKELYNSNQAANGRDHFGNGNKFITPAIVDGRVYVGTPTGVAEFGLRK